MVHYQINPSRYSSPVQMHSATSTTPPFSGRKRRYQYCTKNYIQQGLFFFSFLRLQNLFIYSARSSYTHKQPLSPQLPTASRLFLHTYLPTIHPSIQLSRSPGTVELSTEFSAHTAHSPRQCHSLPSRRHQ